MSTNILSDEVPVEHEKSSLSRRNMAGVIDAAIVFSIFLAGILSLPQNVLSYLDGPLRNELCLLILFVLYRLVFTLALNATIGMRIAGIELLDGDMQKLSITEKLFASFFILINDVSYYKRSDSSRQSKDT